MRAAGAGDTEIELIVRSTDMDADRTVNNAVYFQYFEQGRLEHLLRWEVIAWPPAVGGSGPQFALAQTSANFRAPAFHRDRLIVRVRTAAVGRSSFTLEYVVRRTVEGTLICEGSSVQVWLDGEGRAAALPDRPRAALLRSLDATNHD